ncbi:TylF/MycF/NovP-related O-methyltransferase [Nonomuraea rubra]|uniref:TylF/MycF/NovP-related O-methyltransferase n=1 Tax=Nonomuraea rubra TaxID=46180 RepID=UPI001C88DDE0
MAARGAGQAPHDRFGLSRPVIHPGRLADALPGALPEQITFAYLDVDRYDATLTALRACVPRLAPGAVLLLDDHADLPASRAAAPGQDWGLGLHRVGQSLYVRCMNGQTGAWYRGARTRAAWACPRLHRRPQRRRRVQRERLRPRRLPRRQSPLHRREARPRPRRRGAGRGRRHARAGRDRPAARQGQGSRWRPALPA